MDMKKTSKALAILASAFLATACSQMTVEERMDEAKEAMTQDDYKQAIVHLKAAVQMSPQDLRPRIELAKIYFNVGDMVSAITTFDKVLTQRGDINDFAGDYFLALYSMADLDIFEVTFEEFKNKLNDAEAAKVEIIAAVIAGRARSAELAQEHLAAAKRAAEKLNDPDVSQRVKDFEFIVNTYLLGERGTDISALPDYVEAYQEDWLMRSLTAEIQQASGDYIAAAENYKALQKLKPFFAQLNLKIAESLLKAKMFADADGYINRVLTIAPDNALANQQKALVALSRQDFENAAKHIDIAISQNYVTPSTIYIAGISHFQIGNYEQALSYLEKLVDKFPPNHPGLQMYIAAKLTAGDSLDAYSLYERYPSLVSSNTRLATKAASALLFTGERDKAASILGNVDNEAFNNPAQRQQLGLLKLSAGDMSGKDLLEASSSEIVKSAASGDGYKSKMMLVAIKAAEGDETSARAIVEEWISAEPDNLDNYLIAAQFEKFVGNADALDGIYSKIKSLSPANAEARKYYAEKAFTNGDTRKALEEYSKVLETTPNDEVALTGAFLAAKVLTGAKEDYRKIDAILDNNKETTSFTFLLAAYLQQDFKQVVALARSMIFGYENQPKANFLLAKAYLEMDQPLSALDVLRRAIKSGMTTLTVYQTYFEAVMKADSEKAALREIKNAPEVIKEHPQIQLFKSHVLVNQKKYAEAKQIIDQLPQQVMQSATAQELLGQIKAADDDLANAIPALTRAWKQLKTPKSAQLLYKALVADGQQEKGLQILKESASQSKLYNDADLFYVSELAKVHPQQAIKYYEQLIAEQSRNWQAMNNIAWLLYEQRDLDQAYQWITKALNIRPGNQALLDTKRNIEDALKAKG